MTQEQELALYRVVFSLPHRGRMESQAQQAPESTHLLLGQITYGPYALQGGEVMPCKDCSIKGTEYCHKINPMAKKYTRAEKNELREAMDKGQTAFKEAE